MRFDGAASQYNMIHCVSSPHTNDAIAGLSDPAFAMISANGTSAEPNMGGKSFFVEWVQKMTVWAFPFRRNGWRNQEFHMHLPVD
jgi:hypothetical protein